MHFATVSFIEQRAMVACSSSARLSALATQRCPRLGAPARCRETLFAARYARIALHICMLTGIWRCRYQKMTRVTCHCLCLLMVAAIVSVFILLALMLRVYYCRLFVFDMIAFAWFNCSMLLIVRWVSCVHVA